MKVYQLIYTNVKHSLSDNELGLSSQEGLRVYSCSQGITKENIGEIIKFSTYRLPKNDNTTYPLKVCDPKVPEMFPKTFRTLHLSDGRYAAIQSVYSGVDFEGQSGNFFAHALVFDEFDDTFFPEQYFKSSAFKTHLEEKHIEKELVHYLPTLEDLKPEEDTEKNIIAFIDSHKKELSYLLNKVFDVLSSDDVKNMCIATESEELTENYLLAVKWLLPRDIAYDTGISTYNVYIPSDKQRQIIFNGTIKGKNNITEQSISTRPTCVYVDMDKVDFSDVKLSVLFKKSVSEIREEYKKYNFTSIVQLLDWIATTKNITKPGMGAKLLNFKASAGKDAFKTRVSELYALINNEDMSASKFEITKLAYDNLELFEENSNEIVETYVDQCVDKLCAGENYDIYDLFEDGTDSAARAAHIKKNIPSYMERIKVNIDSIGEKNSYIFLILLSRIKHESETETWKALFDSDKDRISVFVKLASIIITGYGVNAFSPPSVWTEDDLDEVVAYFDSSTQDDRLKESCLKYIYMRDDTDWEKYGITLTSHKKTQGEQESDMRKIKRMLTKVGYIPYQRNNYLSLRGEVLQDINGSLSPLLLSRLLDAYYQWKRSYGNQNLSEKNAVKLRKLILELKKTEKSCYDFIFPKLALEITESNGHYHELIINTETVPESFWNWFIIGFKNSRDDDTKILNYTHIYEANKRKLMRMRAGKQLREVFKYTE